MYDFKYQRASSQADAKEKFSTADDPRYLAGGMTLVPVLKQRLDNPSDIVDLSELEDLKEITKEGNGIRVGAMCSHHNVNISELVIKEIPALAKLAGTIGDPMVRNRGTIGGSLANNDPAASYPSAVLGLNASITTDKRTINADDFFLGMFETALEEGELITSVLFPIPEIAGYQHFPNPASRYPIVGAFVAKTAGKVRVGITGAGPCAYRETQFEEAWADGSLDPQKIIDIKLTSDGLNSDIHASAEYRAHLVNVMARRAIS